MQISKLSFLLASVSAAAFLGPQAALAQTTKDSCFSADWVEKPDDVFATDCVSVAFEGDLGDRQMLAWMFFARISQLIDDPTNGGMSDSGQVPVWMAWPTDPDTFATTTPFDFDGPPRSVMLPSAEKKDIEFGRVATADPDGANEEVTRNRIAYTYLVEQGLTTKAGVAAFFETEEAVNMPVGSVELKASWLQVTAGSPVPPGALTFAFEGGTYWWRGVHIMVKMQSLTNPEDIFYSEDPSWFWTTFEFSDNPGAERNRAIFSTQNSPIPDTDRDRLLAEAGIAGFGYEAYAPNGTQIRFTVDGNGTDPVILGHTDMEDFAGTPNTAQPVYWRQFDASCHSCHATASYNPTTREYFPFSVPTGALDPGYNMAAANGVVKYLGQGFKPLDFMWPIVFQTQ